jgi:ACS family hexuronate transporter-like MFS transporter
MMINTTTTKFKYRWVIVFLLFLATAINYIDRQVIGILKPFIADDLHWNEADYGFIITAFQISYALGLLVTGPFLDKFGTKLGYVWAVIVWSLAGVGHALARSVFGFAVARSILGIGEAANFPAAVKSIAEWFPKKERALAAGLFNSGSTIGAISAPIIVSYVTLTMGWKWAFVITGMLGLVWVVAWLLIYQKPAQHPKLSAEELAYINQDDEPLTLGDKIKWVDLLKYRQTYAICATRFISDWVWWFFLFWIPDYLKQVKDLNIGELVMPLVIIYATASVGGIGGGWLSSYLIKSGVSIDKARKNTILICALCVLPIIFISYLDNIWLIVLFLSLAAAGHQGWAANIFTVVSDIYPKTAVGSMMGISGFFGAIGGALSASFVGLLLESTHSYALIFIIASVMYLVNWLIIKIAIPVIKPIQILKAHTV